MPVLTAPNVGVLLLPVDEIPVGAVVFMFSADYLVQAYVAVSFLTLHLTAVTYIFCFMTFYNEVHDS